MSAWLKAFGSAALVALVCVGCDNPDRRDGDGVDVKIKSDRKDGKRGVDVEVGDGKVDVDVDPDKDK